MKKYLALALALLMVCCMLAGCNSAPAGDEAILESTATPTPTASPTATPTATPEPSVSPTPTVAAPTPNVTEEMDAVIVDAGFDELYKSSEYVLIGTLTKSLGEMNQCRDKKGNPHTSIFMMEKQYTLVVSEVLKTPDKNKVKAKDSVTLSLPYRDKFEGDKDYTMRTFQEPPLNQEMLFFLNRDEITKDIVVFYPENEPHSFLVKDGKLYTYGNSADLAKSFAKGDGASDKGISLAGAKKEMDVK